MSLKNKQYYETIVTLSTPWLLGTSFHSLSLSWAPGLDGSFGPGNAISVSIHAKAQAPFPALDPPSTRFLERESGRISH
jgi:hypothetical protein